MRREQAAIRWFALILILALAVSACGEREASLDTGPEVHLRVGDETFSERVYSYCWPQSDDNVACDVNLAARAQPEQLVPVASGAPLEVDLSADDPQPQSITVTLLDGPGGQTDLAATAENAAYTAPTEPGQYRVQVDVQYADVNGTEAYVSYVFGLDVGGEAVAAAPTEATEAATTEATEPVVDATEAVTEVATEEPTDEPTAPPTEPPTLMPTDEPTVVPTDTPTALPSPTAAPTLTPEDEPTEELAVDETEEATEDAGEIEPTRETGLGIAQATDEPTDEATEEATDEPEPTGTPTARLSATARPTEEQAEAATDEPTEEATAEPTEDVEPTQDVTDEPTDEAEEPTQEPRVAPTSEPVDEPDETPDAGETPDVTAEATPEDTGELGSVALIGNVRIVQERRTVPLTDAAVTFTYEPEDESARHETFETATDATGRFAFDPIDLHEDDIIILTISAPGYATQEIELTGADAYALPVINLILLPLAAPTPEPTVLPTATPVPVEPTATPPVAEELSMYPSGAPRLALAYAGRYYEALGFELCQPGSEGALTDCVQEPTGTTYQRRIALMRGAAAQLLVAGDRPADVRIEYLTDTGVQTGQPEERIGDNIILFTVTPEPGNYIMAIRIAWEDMQVTYYFRVAVSG